MKYIDEYGLVHPTEQGSENGILYLAYYMYLLKICAHTLLGRKLHILDSIKHTTVETGSRYQANPPENGDHFSHDNMKGLYALSHVLGKDFITLLPIFSWNGWIWLHPNGWMVHLAFRFKALKWILLPFLYIMMRYSLKQPKERTSGKLLWWLIFQALYDGKFLAKCDWNHTFHYYFSNAFTYNNEDNPIRIITDIAYPKEKK